MLKRPAPGHIASFDSATAMLRATARFLRGEDGPAIGLSPRARPFPRLVRLLPDALSDRIYALGGANEAIRPKRLGRVNAEKMARSAVSEYPERRYPAVMIGSSNGAAVNLAAALGTPWLPQTLFIPVRRTGVHADELEDMEWAREPGRELLAANPKLQLHYMHDPNQDRLMERRMTYFRVKWRKLPEAYERFLRESLEPGGTIFVLDCRARWPGTEVDDRFYFQPGAMGGLDPEEYFEATDRVSEYLARYESHRGEWDPPAPTGEYPEAEWGFEPALRDDVERFADRHGFRVRRIVFDDPEGLCHLVADLYRWWYAKRRLLTNRLLVSSFLLTEPMWTLRSGSTPFWCKFAVEPSARQLEEYLNRVEPFEEIHIMLFSHGTESAGVAPIERWKEIMSRAPKGGRLIGVDEDAFPRDFGVLASYHDDVEAIAARYPVPGPLTVERFERFVAERAGHYAAEITGVEGPKPEAEPAAVPVEVGS